MEVLEIIEEKDDSGVLELELTGDEMELFAEKGILDILKLEVGMLYEEGDMLNVVTSAQDEMLKFCYAQKMGCKLKDLPDIDNCEKFLQYRDEILDLMLKDSLNKDEICEDNKIK